MATPKVPMRRETRRSPKESRINGEHPRLAQKSQIELVHIEGAEPVREESGLHLHWEGRRLYRSRIPIPRVLEPDKRLSLGADSENLVIEGDNLQVMVSLRSQFNAAVGICYIDPPYNRGGNDFRYSDARFHDPNA